MANSTSSSSNSEVGLDPTDKCLALQWNLRGLRANASELKQLISDQQPVVIALQETMVKAQIIPTDFIGKDYTLLLENGPNHPWIHGVGLAVREGIPFERLQIQTTLQAIAVRIQLPQPITVVSIYLPPNSRHINDQLKNLIEQLPEPALALGDFNAHHPAWGSRCADSLGRFIAENTLTRKLVILNDGSPTRMNPATGSMSSIDLSLCSDTLAPRLSWRVLSDTHNSDHFPIGIYIPGWSQAPVARQKWLYDSADWTQYERLTAASIRPGVLVDLDTFVDRILTAAKASIPRTSGKTGPKAVPWWCPEVKAATKRRRKMLRSLRRLSDDDPKKIDALTAFHDARATARATIRDAKRESWETFVAKISPTSSTTELWQSVNILRGKRRHNTKVIRGSSGPTDDPTEVAEILAQHYSERSATSSYSTTFQIAKEKAERNYSIPSTDTHHGYNADFTLSELLWALDKGRGLSTGPDSIGYPMLQRLPFSVKTALLELFNRIWYSGVFPSNWRTGIIVPIPKPNTTETGPAAFRPITLISCLSKVFERMVNRRLITELETKGRLDKRQHAFRSGHGTDTHFAELESYLPAKNEHCLFASLDLSKAYDTTWRHGILRTLKKWRVTGRLYNILSCFLSDRSFQVAVGGQLSNLYPLENGVPQGSVLSVTLFLVAMQPIFRVVPNGIKVILYADDILLVVVGQKNQNLGRKLQIAVNAVVKWAKSCGFSISSTKSSIFYGSPNARRQPKKDITIDRIPVPKTKQLKILGITLDRTFNFKAHCTQTVKNCATRLRILTMVGAKLPRGARSTLLQVGSAIITSRLLYGMGLVSRGGYIPLKLLSPTYNRMVRLASGAFVTSPTLAIMAESGMLPFDLLLLQSLVLLTIRLLEKNSNASDLPVVQRTAELFSEKTNTTIPRICQRLRTTDREWNAPIPTIVWDVKQSIRAGDPPEKVRPVVQEVIERRFQGRTLLYTDGSKGESTVGAGVFGVGVAKSQALPKHCSVFSAEAYALNLALKTSRKTQIAILTDSASCLSALETGRSNHPWIQSIETAIKNKNVQFCWIPGHAGIQGNVIADRLAGDARNNDPLEVPIPAMDATREVKRTIRQLWDQLWYASRDVKLREVKCTTNLWIDSRNPADQRVLTRLRIGHTRLTHEFLIKRTDPPECECCGTVINVRHILLDCRKYEDARSKANIDSSSLQVVLQNNLDEEKKLIAFLKETNLYSDL